MQSSCVLDHIDQDSSNGLRSIKEITKRLNLDGVYGPLYELFEVSDTYKTAVETTAGNRHGVRCSCGT